VRFNGIRFDRIEWAHLAQVAVDVIDYGDGDAEAFWKLSGEDAELDVPVETVMGSAAFNARLFALPGFDTDAHNRSRKAGSACAPGLFVCWRRQ